MSFARSIKSPQRLIRMITAKITGIAAATLSGTCASNVTAVRNGTGDYTITFEKFPRNPEVLVTCVTDNRSAKIGALTGNTVQILTEDIAGAAADSSFHFMVVGSDAEDLI